MTLVAVLIVIPALLFIAPFVLGSFAIVQVFPARGQVTYFGFCTLFFVVCLVAAALALFLTPV